MGQKDRCNILESDFQYDLINEIKERLPGAVVLKNDAGYIQGFPDLTILYGPCWAVLEVKRSMSAPRQPNQEYYVNMLNAMSFSCFVCPENKEEVLDELEQSFGVRRHSCVSKSK